MTWITVNALRNIVTQITNTDKFKWLVRNTVVTSIRTTVVDKCNLVENIKLHHWPSLMSVWFLLTLIITYSISVGKKHAYKFFPYISDTGTYPPESCIFGLLMNLGTLMMVLNMYLRYRQVEIITRVHDIDCSKWNRTSLWLAMIGCLGMSIIANFQKMNMRGIHFLGANMVLGGGVLYTVFQARISYAFRNMENKVNPCGITNKSIFLRITISAICILLFFVLVGFGYASEKDYEGDLIWWTPQDNGFIPHVIATISEWLIIFLISVFIMSYTNEFKALEFNGIIFKVNE